MEYPYDDWRSQRSPYPHNLIIDIHSYCNARCRICPYPQLKDQLSMGRMEDRLFRRLIDEFAQVKADHPIRGHVVFCNMGELFLDSDVFWKIAYVQDAGLELVIQTNAALLTAEKTERLKACGFKGPIYISFHGITKPVYEELMGLPYDRTLANIHFLLNSYERAKIQIRAYAYEWPLGEAFQVKKYWKAHNVSVKLGVPNSRGGLLSGIKRTHFKYPGPWLRGCKKTLPFRDLVVSFDGKAVLCCEDMGRRAILGDLSRKSLMEVWNGPEAERLMDFLHGGGWGKSDKFICRSCEFGLSTPFRRLMKNLDSQWQLLMKTKL
jgi:hypothetical protein